MSFDPSDGMGIWNVSTNVKGLMWMKDGSRDEGIHNLYILAELLVANDRADWWLHILRESLIDYHTHMARLGKRAAT